MREYKFCGNKNDYIQMSYRDHSHKSLIVLKALLLGLNIEFNEMLYGLAQGIKNGFELVCLTKDTPPKVIGNPSIYFGTFLVMCEKLSNEEIFHIDADMTLNTIKEPKKR